MILCLSRWVCIMMWLILYVPLDMILANLYARRVGSFTGFWGQGSILCAESGIASAMMCQLLCLQNPECMSYFYNKEEKRCQIHSLLFLYTIDAQLKPGSEYYVVFYNHRATGSEYFCNRAHVLCYSFHLENKETWPSARTSCVNKGADLIVLDTYLKAQHIALTINSTSFPSKKFHAGLSDVAVEGTWVWVNGVPVDPALWQDKQPDNGLGSGQNYGVIWKVRKFPMFLNDDDMPSIQRSIARSLLNYSRLYRYY